MEEIWKPLKNYEDSYEISNLGNIKNKDGKIMNHNKNNRGYHLVTLRVQNPMGKNFSRTVLAHRVLAETFIEDTGFNPDGSKMVGKHQVNHKDGNKDNNTIMNLEWCDQSYNQKEAYRLGLREYVPYEVTEEYREKMKQVSARPSPGKEVQMLDKNTLEVIETFESSMEAVRKRPDLNLRDSSIRDAANGRRGKLTYKGYKWKFTGKITNGDKCRESKK